MECVNGEILSETAVTDLIRDIVIDEDVTDPVFEISSGSEKGDGFMSYMTRVNVKGTNKTLSLIIKTAPNNPQIRKSIPTRVAFLQEIKFYSQIFPALKKFQNDRGVKDPFESIPYCYKTVDTEGSERIVMENLKEQGYNVLNKKEPMSKDHVEMIMREYGKFHAVSFAIKDQDIRLFESLTKNMANVISIEEMGEEFFEVFLNGADKMLSLFDEKTEADVCKFISNLKPTILPFFRSMYKFTGKNRVIVHKDGWCNNFMFKYNSDDPTRPTNIRVLDFQLSTISSPAVDLSYFFYAMATQDMLDNLDHYLKIYHESLSTNILEMGSDPNKCFPFSSLMEEWRQYSKYGFIFSLLLYRVLLRDDDELLDFSDKVNDDISHTDLFMKSSKYDEIINDRYRKIALHYYKNKFF